MVEDELEPIVTVMRVITYTGPRSLVKAQLLARGLKGEQHYGRTILREGIIGDAEDFLTEDVGVE